MTGPEAVVQVRRRSLPAKVLVAVAAGLMLTGACGSETAEPALGSLEAAPPTSATPGSAAPTAGAEVAGAATDESPAAVTSPVPSPPVSPAPQSQSGVSPQPPVNLDSSGLRTFPAPEVWEALRQCQSQGDYGFVHSSGEYFGAYQFTVATWDRLAGQRYTELLGILPSEAVPADQDRMAYYLWIESGHTRWPACGHVFTGDLSSIETIADTAEPGEAAEVTTTVEGVPFEPAPGDDGTTPAPGATTTTSPADLPSLDIDPALQPAVPPNVEGFPTPEQWEALRFCESSGNYRAVSRNGLYYGAYQFWPDTWDFVAERNYPRLVGILPSAATTQDQDRMAYRLWEERGDQPWPVCGRYLRPGAE